MHSARHSLRLGIVLVLVLAVATWLLWDAPPGPDRCFILPNLNTTEQHALR